MADEVEVEEHDVLENPYIKRIFPDLSIIKKEINDYNDYDGCIKSSHSSEHTEDSRAISITSEDNQTPYVSLSVTSKYQNNITPDPEPTISIHDKQKLDVHLKKAKVCVQNILPLLNNNPNYCKMCLILFPSEESFKEHRLYFHSEQMDTQIISESSNISNKKMECDKGNKTFEKDIHLNRHQKIVDPSHQNIQDDDKKITGANIMVKINDTEHNELPESNLKECFHCPMMFKTQQSLIDHLYDVLSSRKTRDIQNKPVKQIEDIKQNKLQRDISVQKKNKTTKTNCEISQKIKIFRCPICSYCFNQWEFYELHMKNKHDIFRVTRISKVFYQSNCKFCHLKYSTYKSYNTHLHKRHKSKILQKVGNQYNNPIMIKTLDVKKSTFNAFNDHRNRKMVNEEVLNKKRETVTNEQVKNINEVQVMAHKTFLFECSQCNVNFLTSISAKNHTEHSLLENLKCELCQKLFKVKDINIHLEQHKYSNYISVNTCKDDKKKIKLRDDKILHKCPSCAVHFSEEQIFTHYPVCEKEPPQTAYCRLCDILISDNIKTSHEREHDENKLDRSDFKIVEFEMQSKKPKKIDKQGEKPITPSNGVKSLFHLIQCNVCNCNILKAHYKSVINFRSHCAHFIKYVCKYCGLVFSNKSINNHRKLHQKYDNLSLKDFTFYDIMTGKKVLPSLPVFPKCKSCQKHFISKFEIKTHTCYQNNRYICPICNIKLSKTAYDLHMPFHQLVLNDEEIIQNSSTLVEPNLPTVSRVVKKNEVVAIFTCINCIVSFNSYNEAIDHCHLHADLDAIDINTFECNICDLQFEKSCYDPHQKLHADFPKEKCIFFEMDVYHFGLRNDKWIKHVFDSMSKEIIEEILHDSIYRHEARLKMRIIQEGTADGTVYKCGKCESYIQTNSIYEHYLICGSKPSSSMFDENNDTCEGNTTIRIVSLNEKEDEDLNNRIRNMRKYYVLYECRACHMVINGKYENHSCAVGALKDCSICGLLFNEVDYATHVEKHKRLSSFKGTLMKVILLGAKLDQKSQKPKDQIMSKFSGIVCDYTFYRCLNCEVCVRDYRNTFQHYCLIDAAKSKCPKCDLVFDEGKLKGHLKLHDTDPYFVKETMFIESFGSKLNVKSPPKSIAYNEVTITGVSNDSVSDVESKISNRPSEETINIYRCKCGLHYLSETTAQKHMMKCSGQMKMKQSKQNCFKCNLTFSPDVLFKHLIDHHGNKNITFKYEIVQTSLKSADERTETTTE